MSAGVSRTEAWAQTAMGLMILAAAGGLLAYGVSASDAGGRGGYPLVARFGEVGALAPGADVSVAGVKVGAVDRIELAPRSYLAVVHLSLDKSVALPEDSTAKITTNGLLGGAHVAITPGASSATLGPGGEIDNTQGAVDLFGLIGSVMRPPAPEAPDGASAGAP